MDTVTRLKNVPLFSALTPENLERVASIVTRHQYARGSLLWRQEEYGDQLYVIDSGEVVLRQTDLRGLERPTTVLRPGEWVGDDSLLLGDAYGSSAQALTPVVVLCIHKKRFEQLLQDYPEILRQLRPRPLVKERLRTRAMPGQEPDEPWLLRRQRHWLAFVQRASWPMLALVAVAIAALTLYWFELASMATLLVLIVLPTVMLAGWLLWLFIDWKNDYYLVTTKRLLHRELSLLRLERREEAPLTKVQNINLRRKLLGGLLGFATLEIETAGARQPIVLDYLRDAESMKEVIFKQAAYLQSRGRLEEREQIRQELLRGKDGQVPEVPAIPTLPPEPRSRTLLDGLRLSRPLFRLSYVQGERKVWRKHWVFLLKHVRLALPAFLLVSATLATLFMVEEAETYLLPLFLGCLVLWTATLCWIVWEVEDWRNDEYIVTDSAIIDITKKPLFFDEVKKEATLDMIQNVTSQRPGILAALLNYGNVLIQTAGPHGTFNFAGVGHPAQVQGEIFRRMEAYREAKLRREREQRRAELAEWFRVHDEMRHREEPTPSA